MFRKVVAPISAKRTNHSNSRMNVYPVLLDTVSIHTDIIIATGSRDRKLSTRIVINLIIYIIYINTML